jgi:hypothetical protein
MNQYATVIATLTAAMLCFMVMRIYGDWLRISAASEQGTPEELDGMRESIGRWQMRHVTGVVLSVALFSAICFLPQLHDCGKFAGAIAAYAVVSCCLAATEAVLMQRLAAVMVRVTARR